jgi:uncharacterized protein (TIGR02757 family)
MQKLQHYLDQKVMQFNNLDFIAKDPISIPHRFHKLQDIEIAGFFAATFAWGNRTSIIKSCTTLLNYMDNSPFQFILEHTDSDLKNLLPFVHRTFNATDLYYFISFLKFHYTKNNSLESAFCLGHSLKNENVELALISFYNYFFSMELVSERTKKHVASPYKKSACKRLNMFLRWMVRDNSTQVDFGLWKNILSSQLIIPIDVHVAKVAYSLELLPNLKSNWQNAVSLTNTLKKFDPNDPTKYDFALFGLGIAAKYN